MEFNPDLLLNYLDQDSELATSTLAKYRLDVLKKTILKKYVPEARGPQLHVEAISRFLELNERIAAFQMEPSFKSSELVSYWREDLFSLLMTGEYQTTIGYGDLLNRGYCGPGSSRHAKDTSLYTKMFDSSLTTTSPFLLAHYKSTISTKWYEAEEIRSNTFKSGIVKGSALTTVPKDSTKNRTTCTEPTLNMFYQLGMKEHLVKVLERQLHWSNNAQPEINKSLARDSSVSGKLSTLDLKDASDSVSLQLCELLLPVSFMNMLRVIRSPCTEVNNKTYDLSMVGTMGNGFTFHLMTLMFSSLIRSLYRLNNIAPIMGVNYSVFGDDLIVVTGLVPDLVSALNASGFNLNMEKSFFTGNFRESCGGDFYHGHNVRGIYIKEFNNETNVYDVFNRLHFWSIRNAINLRSTLRYLKRLAVFRPVPRHESQDSGFIVTSNELLCPKRNRGGSIIYHCLNPVPFERDVSDLYKNHPGAEICFLGGFVRDNKVTLRSNKVKYTTVRRVTHNWDAPYLADFDFTSGRYQVVFHKVNFMDDPEITSRDLSFSWLMLLSID